MHDQHALALGERDQTDVVGAADLLPIIEGGILCSSGLCPRMVTHDSMRGEGKEKSEHQFLPSTKPRVNIRSNLHRR